MQAEIIVTESRERELQDVQAAVAAFLAGGGKVEVLPGPSFKPLPLRRPAASAPPKRWAIAAADLRKADSVVPDKRATSREIEQAREEHIELIERIRLKDSFRHLEESRVDSILAMAKRTPKLSPRQIAYRCRLENHIVENVLAYHQRKEDWLEQASA